MTKVTVTWANEAETEQDFDFNGRVLVEPDVSATNGVVSPFVTMKRVDNVGKQYLLNPQAILMIEIDPDA